MDLPDRLAGVSVEHTRSRAPHRRHVERLLDLAQWLDGDDRFLIEQVYRHGLRVADIARQSGRGRSTVYYHIHKLLKRMRSPLFRFLAAHGDLLPPPVRRTAELVVFHGLSLRAAAARSGRSLHKVRQHMYTLTALARL